MGFQFNWRERIFDRSVKLTKSVFPIRCNMLFYVQSSHYFWKCVTLSISNYQYRYHNQYQSFTPTFSTSSTPIVSRRACTNWSRKWIIKSTHTHTHRIQSTQKLYRSMELLCHITIITIKNAYHFFCVCSQSTIACDTILLLEQLTESEQNQPIIIFSRFPYIFRKWTNR